MIPRAHKYCIIIVICVCSFLYQFKIINQFPQHIHAWAQCDRYALALGFIDNGGDLFHPQTYVMNNQFPGEFMIPRSTTVTSVDFPIHDYIVSWIMRIAHSTQPWCFRLYTLVCSIIGLYFLYRLTALFTKSLTRALFVVLFALSSPVFLYYEAGFLPTLPALATIFAGLFFFFNSIKTDNRKQFYLSVLFITLSAMARLPFAIIIVAVGCFEGYSALKNKRIELYKVACMLIAIVCIAAYYLYNDHLRKEYGSLFLNYIIPASSRHELLDFTKIIIERWKFNYFNPIAYFLLIITSVTFLLNLIKRQINLSSLEKQFIFFISIVFAGCCLYYLLMTYQFINHDYYFLDTFYMPVVGLFLFMIAKWTEINYFKTKKYAAVLALLVFIPGFLMSKHVLKERRDISYTGEPTTAESYKNANGFLDSLHIPNNAKILTFSSDGSNNSFVLMRRKGFVIIEPTKEKIETALKWPYDYIVVDDIKMISTVYSNYPEIIHQLTKIAGNGLISIYKRAVKPQNITETEFFSLNKEPVLYDTLQDFELVSDPEIKRIPADSATGYNKFFGFTDSVTEYGYTCKLKSLTVLKTKNCLIKVSCIFPGKLPVKNVYVCLSLKVNNKDVLFKASDVSSLMLNTNRQPAIFLYAIPKIENNDSELGVFIWNRSKNKVLYDDFQITIY